MGKAIQTRNHMVSLLKDPSIDQKRKQLFDECMDIYNAIIMNWLSETPEGLLDKMGVVPTNVELCEMSFKRPIKSPICKDSKATYELSKVAFLSYRTHIYLWLSLWIFQIVRWL